MATAVEQRGIVGVTVDDYRSVEVIEHPKVFEIGIKAVALQPGLGIHLDG